MRKIPEEKIAAARMAHVRAVLNYVQTRREAEQRELFQAVTAICPCEHDFAELRERDDWSWLEGFLTADVDTLRRLTREKPEALQFDQFLKLYKNRFCNGADIYVDEKTRYNAYTLCRNLGVTVCPYCDEEYLHVLEAPGQKPARTLELDHFFPKGRYPALAMCFYNLVPSGQACNGIKKEQAIGMSPYEADIEAYTRLCPDLPPGVNMESVPVEDCVIHFHPEGAMRENVEALRLEERYLNHRGEAHRYLVLKQNFNEDKLQELVRMGVFPSLHQAREVLYGEVAEKTAQPILQKLKHDILTL